MTNPSWSRQVLPEYPERAAARGFSEIATVRVSCALLPNASLTDCVFELKRETTPEEVNTLFKAASETYLAGILGYEERPLVSADYARDTRSAIVDALSTMVTDGTLLKVYAWYDNEMGYACRMVDLACHMESMGI